MRTKHHQRFTWLLLPLMLGLAASCSDRNAPLAPDLAPAFDHALATGDVLILGSTVAGGASSREALAVAALGLTSQIVTNAQWAAMSASDFAQYRAIVLGDPNCLTGTGPIAAAEANRHVWGPMITGNVIIVGTDPTLHQNSGHPNAGQVTSKGIEFAVDAVGRTGAYITTSCYYHGVGLNTPVRFLDGLSPLGDFTARGVPGCFNDAYKTADHPALAGLTNAMLSNWGCSIHNGFDSWPSDFEVLAIGRGVGAYFTAPDGTQGVPYIMARGEGIVVISDIQLTPASAINPIGTSHTLTATVSSNGLPVVGTTVTFTVEDGPHAGLTLTGTTNASGVATASYTGTTEGTDGIRARFTDALGRVQTSTRVTKTWVRPSDTVAPSCAITAVGMDAAGKKYVEVTTSDAGSGLAEILVTIANNSEVVVPPFVIGTNGQVVVRATKIVQTQSSQVAMRVTDVAGNITECDPVDVTVARENAAPHNARLTGIPQAERWVTVRNGEPGLTNLRVEVNGVLFQVAGLHGGEQRTIDIASALRPGTDNTVRLIPLGKPGGSAWVMIHD